MANLDIKPGETIEEAAHRLSTEAPLGSTIRVISDAYLRQLELIEEYRATLDRVESYVDELELEKEVNHGG